VIWATWFGHEFPEVSPERRAFRSWLVDTPWPSVIGHVPTLEDPPEFVLGLSSVERLYLFNEDPR